MNVHEAKAHLSRLPEAVEAWEDVVIARAGRPVTRLVAATVRAEPRTPGSWRGRGFLADGVDEKPEDLIRLLRQGPSRPS